MILKNIVYVISNFMLWYRTPITSWKMTIRQTSEMDTVSWSGLWKYQFSPGNRNCKIEKTIFSWKTIIKIFNQINCEWQWVFLFQCFVYFALLGAVLSNKSEFVLVIMTPFSSYDEMWTIFASDSFFGSFISYFLFDVRLQEQWQQHKSLHKLIHSQQHSAFT